MTTNILKRLTTFSLLALVLFFFQNCNSKSDSATSPGTSSSTNISQYPAQFRLAGLTTAHGIFDPSLAQDPSTTRIWMSYSAVNISAMWPNQNVDVVSTRLAHSDDKGATWSDTGAIVNDTLDVNLAIAAPNNAGTWQHEVSDLVFDPGAPANEKWKLVSHHYLVLNNNRLFQDGWIALKMASSPEQLATATEIKLFSGSTYDTSNNIAGGGSGSPLGGAPSIALDTALSSELNGCGVFTEPGMLATSSALYMSLMCAKSASDHRIILLKCASPCRATTASGWSYLGTVLSENSSLPFGFNEGFSGSNIVSSNGNNFLIVTPMTTTPFDGYYNGCKVFKFSNIDSATLQSTAGVPDVVATVNGDAGAFSGACSYLPGASISGVVYGQAFFDTAEQFRLYFSGVNF